MGSRLPDPATLPVASNGHWMPLTSMVAVVVHGPCSAPPGGPGRSPWSSSAPLLVPFTYWIGWELWQRRWVRLLAGILAIFAGPLLVYYPTVENFAVFGVFGALSLYAAMRAVLGRAGPAPGWSPPACSPGWRPWHGSTACSSPWRRPSPGSSSAAGASAAAGLWGDGQRGGAFLVVLSPWLSRDLATSRRASSPAPAATRCGSPATTSSSPLATRWTLAGYLAWGWGNIIGSKLELVVRHPGTHRGAAGRDLRLHLHPWAVDPPPPRPSCCPSSATGW